MCDSDALRVLVVDDDGDILDLLKYNLEKEGFKVKTLERGHKTISVAKEFSPDLIILDIMMPHLNGMEICTALRKLERFEKTYIFFLTARSGSYYQQSALETGGDDYIEKVMGLRALICKVNSVLKSHLTIRKSVSELVVGHLKLNRASMSIVFRNREIKLSLPEFELLYFFAQNPGKDISIENIIHNIWGSEIYLFYASVEIYIENLRKKISPEIIKVLRNERFRFIVS